MKTSAFQTTTRLSSFRRLLPRISVGIVTIAALLVAEAKVCAAAGPRLRLALEATLVEASDPPEYRLAGSGWVEYGGSWGTSYQSGAGSYRVMVEVRTEEARLLAKVQVMDGTTGAQVKVEELDFADFQARHVRLPSSESETCVLNLMPRTAKPEPGLLELSGGVSDAVKLGLTQWNFRQSGVVLDNRYFAGRIEQAKGGPLAWVEIPGEARVDWATLPFDGAEKTGVLYRSWLHLDGPDGRQLDIWNVGLSDPIIDLADRKIQIWSRWSKPRYSRMEAAEAQRKVFDKWGGDLLPSLRDSLVARIERGHSLTHGTRSLP